MRGYDLHREGTHRGVPLGEGLVADLVLLSGCLVHICATLRGNKKTSGERLSQAQGARAILQDKCRRHDLATAATPCAFVAATTNAALGLG